MDWTKILTYADDLGFEFFFDENKTLTIYRGNNKATLKQLDNSWVLQTTARLPQQMSTNPCELLERLI